MVKDHLTPEDRLLRLIETPAKIKSAFMRNKFTVKAPQMKDLWGKLKFNKDIFSFDFISKAFIGLAAILTLILVVQILFSSRDFNSSSWEPASVASKNETEKAYSLLPLSDYLAELGRGSMFSGVTQETAQATQTQVQEDVSEQLKNLKLVGIIWSNKPQAMIENVAEAKTLLLNIGDQVGKVKIKNIYPDRVILATDSQEWELR